MFASWPEARMIHWSPPPLFWAVKAFCLFVCISLFSFCSFSFSLSLFPFYRAHPLFDHGGYCPNSALAASKHCFSHRSTCSRKGDPPEVFFWKSIFESRPSDLKSAQKIVQSAKSQNAVYIPAEVAHPMAGSFLLSRVVPSGLKLYLLPFMVALILDSAVTVFDHIHPQLLPYVSTFYSLFMSAFPYPGYWHGDCANCLWSGCADCS